MKQISTLLLLALGIMLLSQCAQPVVYEGPTPTVEVTYKNDKPCK